MKKLISLMLAVSVMLASSSAFALSLTASGQRNPGGWSNTVGGKNSNVIRSAADGAGDLNKLAVYRPGDSIGFKIESGLGGSKGDTITFISSVVDQDLSNATVMFVDQIVADSATPTYTYKIRENLPEGKYKLDVKVGDAEVSTFYYGVADPKVQIATIDAEGTQQAYVNGDKAQYFGSASIGGGFLFEQAGVADFGFDFGNGNVATTAAEAFDYSESKSEIGGVANWWFTMVLTDVEGAAPTVAETIVNE